MTDYIAVPVETNPDDLLAIVWDFIQARVADWEPSEGNFEVILAEALIEVIAELRDLAGNMPTTLFRYFGANIVGLPPNDAVPAQGTFTWTMKDTAGYTIPQGSAVALAAADGTLCAFQALADTVIPNGSSTANIIMEAVLAGEMCNGLTGTATPVDFYDYVTSVVVVGSTDGGAEAEEDEVYLARLVEELRLQSPRPILPDDFAVMAQAVEGVGRACVINLFKYDTLSSGEAGHITIGLADADGEAVSGAVKSAVSDNLAGSVRVLNLTVWVEDPVYDTIKVSYDATALAGYDATAVKANIDAALTEYFDPANWGVPNGAGVRPNWINTTTVRGLNVAQVILSVEGVAYLNAATQQAKGADALSTSDVTLTGPISLTRMGVITGTVV